MCDVIFTVDGEVGSAREMNQRGWTITPDDIDPIYSDLPWDTLKDDDTCLCPYLVAQVLDRHGVQYEEDVWGWYVAPLKAEP